MGGGGVGVKLVGEVGGVKSVGVKLGGVGVILGGWEVVGL